MQGAGTGVFATQSLKAGTHLGYYCGRVYWRYPKTNARDWAYMLRLDRRPPWIPLDVWNAKRISHSSHSLHSLHFLEATNHVGVPGPDGTFKAIHGNKCGTNCGTKCNTNIETNRVSKDDRAVCVDGRGTLSLINCCRGKFETDAKVVTKTTTTTKTRELEQADTEFTEGMKTTGFTEKMETRGARCKDNKHKQDKKEKKEKEAKEEKESTNKTGLCAFPLENCIFVSTGRCETTRDIDVGQELFVDYGVEYWQDR